MLTYL
ncbi:uncharacterized protein FFM5_09398 [Fusarium fujikuroi]|jgi:hypothetical protein